MILVSVEIIFLECKIGILTYVRYSIVSENLRPVNHDFKESP